MIAAALCMGALGLLLGALLASIRNRFQPREGTVADAVEALLPQTQCAQCGYPGCRPYAEAIVAGARLDACPPGGQETATRIAALLGREAEGPVVAEATAQTAVIDEAACIGCALCLDACPVDAIVGASKFVHTVIEARCTGCELCLPPCPVDCIALVPRQEEGRTWPRP